MTVPLVFMTVTGLVIGVITTTAVARSIAVPVCSGRSRVEAVEAGDLEAVISVDDPGDLAI